MNIQKFTLYDVTVDLVPGITTILLLLPIFPRNSLMEIAFFGNSFKFSVLVLIAGYVVGRLLHAVSGSDIIEEWASDTIFFGHPLNQNNRRSEALKDPFHKNLPTEKIPLQPEEGVDPREFRYLGESLLYGRLTLYRKYEILSTFFRNLWFFFLFGSLFYSLHFISVYMLSYDSIWSSNTEIMYPYLLGPLGLYWFSRICFGGWVQFESQKSRAFVNDISLYIAQNEDVRELFQERIGDETE